jgi:hypothetical protein
VSFPNGAIVRFGANTYVFAGGHAFVATPSELGALQNVDRAAVLNAPVGVNAPTPAVTRTGTLLTTKAVNAKPTIYVVGTDGELHGFSTYAQFARDGYDAALVVTVPSISGLSNGSTVGVAGAGVTALATRADGAIVESGRTFYVFAGGRAFGIAKESELIAVRKADNAAVLRGTIGQSQTAAAIASGALLSAPGTVYVSYEGAVYPFKTEAQFSTDGYSGTAAVPVPGTGTVPVQFPYSAT